MIRVRGDFDFVYRVPTFRSLWCFLKTGEKVEANFNKLEIDSPGNVWIPVKEKVVKVKKGEEPKEVEKNYFVKISQILPQQPADEDHFNLVSKEIKQISLKRKKELRTEKKQFNREKIS